MKIDNIDHFKAKEKSVLKKYTRGKKSVVFLFINIKSWNEKDFNNRKEDNVLENKLKMCRPM